jgi:hypothetical protein
MIATVPTYINICLVIVSHTVLSCGGSVVISSCIRDDRELLEVEQLGAGAPAGLSVAGPAFMVYAVGWTSSGIA